MRALTYDLLLAPIERLALRKLRHATLATAQGRVLEIGIGTGLNLPHYAPSVQLVGIDPDPDMLARARKRATRLQHTVTWLQGSAEALPFEDRSFNTVVGTLVFCTIPDPARAFREMVRMLRADGRIYLLEHVRSPHPWGARFQDWITPAWKRVFHGCHPNRDTLATAQAAGLRIEHVQPFLGGMLLIIEASLA